jgi:serine/threonine-protein kinase
LSDLPAPLANALADRYRLERELGRGGMAIVYLARDLKHDRPVALKVLLPEIAATLGPERFEREIRFASALQHPNVLPLFDSGRVESRVESRESSDDPSAPSTRDSRLSTFFYYVMPYVEGESLRDRLKRERQLPLADAIRITTDAARALDYAHGHGVIHRDIKPENILLTPDGSTLVADFGIARALDHADAMTQTGMAIGTLAYMSPEQAAGERHLDGRTDIYSLGCVLYEMLAGEPPFTGATHQAVLAKQLGTHHTPASVIRDGIPQAVDRALDLALAKSPADRFATGAQFAVALIEPSTAAGRGRGRQVVGVGLVVAVLLGALWWRSLLVPPKPTAPPAAGANSIAVLPLTNVGEDSTEQYFADGMTDELTSEIGKIPGFKVASRTSAYVFKDRHDLDAREIGRRLGVAVLLEGTVRRSGNRLRIVAQLTNAVDGLTLWSETYEREPKDVFAVQDDIARSIITALKGRLVDNMAGLGGRRSTNMEAHDLLLRARYAFERKTEPELRKSLALYQAALVRDSGYAEAWAGIANVWMWLADDWLPPRDAYPRAKDAALRSLALDSTLAEAHDALGNVLFQYDWNFKAAEREFRRAVALNPNSASGYSNLGILLSITDRHTEAQQMLRQAESIDPLDPGHPAVLGRSLWEQGRSEEAIAQFNQALDLNPGFTRALVGIAEVRIQQERVADALKVLDQAPETGILVMATRARAQVFAGHREAAQALLRQIEEEAAHRYIRGEAVAVVFAALGEPDSAFAWLDRAYAARSSGLVGLNVWPIWSPIRSDPRFKALMAKVGLE